MGKTRLEELCYELYGSSKQHDSWHRYAMVRELRELMKQPKASGSDEELVETEVATEFIGIEDETVKHETNTEVISAIVKEESIPQSKVSIPQSNSEILKRSEPEKVDLELEKLELNENLEQEWVQKNISQRFEFESDVERDQEVQSMEKICAAYQVLGKMSQHETLGIKKKTKGFKSWRFKFKQGNRQRCKLRSAHQLIHRGNIMYKSLCSSAKVALKKKNKFSITWPMLNDDCFIEDDHVYQEGLLLWLLVRFKFWKFKFVDRKLQNMMREQGFSNHLKLRYYSLKRESGTKVHHANTQASKSVSDVLRTTLGPSSMLKRLLDAVGIVVTTDGNAILREIDVAHPAAKSMIELSRTQDEKVVQEFYGIHGSIIGPWHLAFDPGGIISCTACDDFVVTHTRWVRHDKLEGCSNVQTSATDMDDKEKQAYVSVLQAVIESHQDSHLVFLAGYAVRALDILQEYKKGENQTNAELVREEDWEVLLKLEEAYIENICVQILKFKPALVITEKRFSDLACHYFSKAGVSTIRRLRKTDNNRIAKVCGAVIVNRPDELQESDVIICPLADHLKPEYVVFFTKEASGKLEQFSGLCKELKDIDVSLASFYVWLRQTSFVVQQVRRNKKIRLPKRWWFKYKCHCYVKNHLPTRELHSLQTLRSRFL